MPARLKGNRVRFSDSPAAVCQRPRRRWGHDARHDAIALLREKAPPVEIGEPEDLPNSFVFLLPEPRCAAFLCGAQGPRGRRARRCRRENRRGPRGLGWCRGRAPEGGGGCAAVAPPGRGGSLPFPCLLFSPLCAALAVARVASPCRRGRVVGNFFIQPY